MVLQANPWVQQFQNAHARSRDAPDACIILSDMRLSEQQAQHSRTRNIPVDTEIAMMLEYQNTSNVSLPYLDTIYCLHLYNDAAIVVHANTRMVVGLLVDTIAWRDNMYFRIPPTTKGHTYGSTKCLK